ncbi:MAG TPA: hypothetical protein PKD54_02255 [Pirellulaceae bacterium]|nr:hypothetical protein [Pirellulaceae bacterium]
MDAQPCRIGFQVGQDSLELTLFSEGRPVTVFSQQLGVGPVIVDGCVQMLERRSLTSLDLQGIRSEGSGESVG